MDIYITEPGNMYQTVNERDSHAHIKSMSNGFVKS